MSIAIVTDSTADLPPELMTTRNIHVVPAILIIDGQQLEDGEGISRQEFYQRLPGMNSLPTTATPAIGKFEEIYEKVFNSGIDQIVSIHAPARLSGIFNSAQVAATKFGKKVHIVDSGQVTLGLGFQVLGAAEDAKNGLPLVDILEHVEDIRRRIHLVAMLDTLEYVRRSGRVSWAKASIGVLLQIKPFIGLKDGIVLRLGESRTRRKGIARLYELLRELGPLEHLAILHTNAESEAYQMMQEFAHQGSSHPLIVNVTSIIGTHVGPNGLGFVAVTQ
jgi:DegV family protein with EDD domain